jgi:hypothetical protein
MPVRSVESRSHFNYKQRPQTPEWKRNYDLVFKKKTKRGKP